jgi:hypothetical protein
MVGDGSFSSITLAGDFRSILGNPILCDADISDDRKT